MWRIVCHFIIIVHYKIFDFCTIFICIIYVYIYFRYKFITYLWHLLFVFYNISIKRGTSLYEEIHIHSRKSSIRTKIQILRKICQAMGYLHAKGIVLRMLNTRNIFLEPKVKISAIDCGLPEKKYHRWGIWHYCEENKLENCIICEIVI